jgi:hypothetical protein
MARAAGPPAPSPRTPGVPRNRPRPQPASDPACPALAEARETACWWPLPWSPAAPALARLSVRIRKDHHRDIEQRGLRLGHLHQGAEIHCAGPRRGHRQGAAGRLPSGSPRRIRRGHHITTDRSEAVASALLFRPEIIRIDIDDRRALLLREMAAAAVPVSWQAESNSESGELSRARMPDGESSEQHGRTAVGVAQKPSQ